MLGLTCSGTWQAACRRQWTCRRRSRPDVECLEAEHVQVGCFNGPTFDLSSLVKAGAIARAWGGEGALDVAEGNVFQT